MRKGGEQSEERKKEEHYLLLSIKYNPNDHIAHARLGRTYGFQHRWDESEKHFRRSLEINPSDRITQKWYEIMQQARYHLENR